MVLLELLSVPPFPAASQDEDRHMKRLTVEIEVTRGLAEGAYQHRREVLLALVESLDQFFWKNWEAIQVLRVEDQAAAWDELLAMMLPEPVDPVEPVGGDGDGERVLH
ncbi:MAG: hypothetical protein ACYCZB_03080 [Acidiphilium sp.]